MRNGVQYARFETKNAPMFDPAVAAKVAEHVVSLCAPGFDAVALIEEKCGRYVRGKHKGQLRGWASITRCVEGGWSRARNGVVFPGTLISVSIGDDFSGKTYLEVGR